MPFCVTCGARLADEANFREGCGRPVAAGGAATAPAAEPLDYTIQGDMPHQLKRLARRATMGLARDGSTSGNGSGDIFIAFSTANPGAAAATDVSQLAVLPNDRMNPLFEAVVQATEEAILNAMFAAETMTGRDDHKVEGLPIDRVREILKKYNRLAQPVE